MKRSRPSRKPIRSMQARKVAGGYLLRLERGEDVREALTAFVARQRIPCGVLQGIGAVKNVTLGYFDLRLKQYRTSRIAGTVEVVSLMGNIAYTEGAPYIHAHIVVAGPRHTVHGGHLFDATVAITLEVYLKVIRGRLNRINDPKMGFNFWDLS